MPLGICSSYKEWSTSICTDTGSLPRCIAFEVTSGNDSDVIYQVKYHVYK